MLLMGVRLTYLTPTLRIAQADYLWCIMIREGRMKRLLIFYQEYPEVLILF